MNNVSLVGRLTRDPELRTVSTGNTTCSFSLAVNRQFANAQGERETDFINCVIWGKQAENLCKYCTKGSLIGIQGRIQTRNYDDQDGKKVYITEVYAQNVTFLGSKNSNDVPSFYGRNDNINQSYPFDERDTYTNHNSFNERNTNVNQSPIETTDITEDPFKDFGSEVILNDNDLPF